MYRVVHKHERLYRSIGEMLGARSFAQLSLSLCPMQPDEFTQTECRLCSRVNLSLANDVISPFPLGIEVDALGLIEELATILEYARGIPASMAKKIAWWYVERVEQQIWAQTDKGFPDAAAIEAGALRLVKLLEQRCMEYALWGCGWLLALVCNWGYTTMWTWIMSDGSAWTETMPDWSPWIGLAPPDVPCVIPRK